MENKRPYQAFGEWVKTARQDVGLTQQELAERMGYEVSLLRKVEAGERRPSENFKQQLAIVTGIPVAAIPIPGLLTPAHIHIPDLDGVTPEPGPIFPGSYLPLRPNPLFTGRQHELHQIAHVLTNGRTIAVGSAIATTGLGGIGKTQLAVEFAHRYGRYFTGGVFWLNFADPQMVPQEIARCGRAHCLNLRPDYDQLPLKQQVRLVQRAWQENVPRLLIFDNCEDENLFAQWQPTHGGCHVLLTSRRARWDPSLGIAQLSLDTLNRAESIQLLQQFVPGMSLAEAADMAAELGDLPLALHLAGSFLARDRESVSPTTYLAQLQAARLTHPSLRAGVYSPTAHEMNVRRTFALSVGRLDTAVPTDHMAQLLLARAACFAPGEPILVSLLQATLPQTDIAIEPLLYRLEELGLVTIGEMGHVRLHQLVAEFMRETAVAATDFSAIVAVEETLIAQTTQYNATRDLYPVRDWQPHLVHVTKIALVRQDERSGRLALALGRHLHHCADYFKGARHYLETAVAIHEKVWGNDHVNIVTSLHYLGQTYLSAEEFPQSEQCQRRALAICQAQLGEMHRLTADSYNNLGLILMTISELSQGQHYLEKALPIYQQTLGDNHPDTAFCYHCLGLIHLYQVNYQIAEYHLNHAIILYEKIHGSTHSSTARVLNALGLLYLRQGNPVAARPLLERAYTVRKEVLGEMQSETVTTLHNLGVTYRELGEFDRAIECSQQAMAAWEVNFGPDSTYIAKALNSLGATYNKMGRYAESRDCLERALKNRLEGHGEMHFDTADTLFNLGELAEVTGDLPAASAYYVRALRIHEQMTKPSHPQAVACRQALASLDGRIRP